MPGGQDLVKFRRNDQRGLGPPGGGLESLAFGRQTVRLPTRMLKNWDRYLAVAAFRGIRALLLGAIPIFQRPAIAQRQDFERAGGGEVRGQGVAHGPAFLGQASGGPRAIGG